MTGIANGSDAIISSNVITDYSYVFGSGLVANCVTGLGPTDDGNNTM